jgi:type IV pilus assembly protein PilA
MVNSASSPGARDERGFTLVELLVVILIIGILAAIAIPSFLSQSGKANDASAKSLVRTAETAAETYAADHNGAYKGMSVAEAQALEPSLNEKTTASLLKAEEKEGGYLVESESVKTKNKFAIERTKSGEVKRTCTTVKPGGCPASGEW